MAEKLHVKKDDTVVVISGDDKGKKGKVLKVSPAERKIIVDGVNVVTKHAKPRKQGEAGGILKVEGSAFLREVRQDHESRTQDPGRQEDPCLRQVRR